MDFSQNVRNWAEGVVTSIEPDELPAGASPNGRNTAFYSVGGNRAILGKRAGFATMNRTPITGSPAVIGMHEYKKRNGLVFDRTHLLVSNTGRLDSMAADGTLTTISATAFTSGDHYPDFATAKDLEFIVNGEDKKKFDGTDVTNFGIERPSAPTAAAGAAGTPDGTYDIALSFYNSTTGHESSRSDADSVAVSSQVITVTLPTVGLDPQVDYIRVHIRKQGLQSNFFRVVSGSGFNSTHSGWAVGTTSVTIDLSDSDLNNLIIVSPTTAENDPPPDGVDKIAWHGNRLFVADAVNVYWSEEHKPESFRPAVNYEPITTDEGISISCLHAAHEVLMVFATQGLYILRGTNPATWEWELLFPDIGAVSKRTVKTVNGKTFWWSEQHGPMMWKGIGLPITIGTELISTVVADEALNVSALYNACTGVDTANKRVVFAVPETGQTRNTLMLPFNYTLERWESLKWDPMDVASLGMAQNSSTGRNHFYVGGYAGQVFRYGGVDADGIADGDHSGTFIATDASMDEFTPEEVEGVPVSFDTTGGKLIERKVTIEDSNGMRVARYRISANTETTFTTAQAVTGLIPGATYTFYIGGPDFRLESRWEAGEDPFEDKRADYAHLQVRTTGGVAVDVNVVFSFNYTNAEDVSEAVLGSTGSAWDTLVWDETVWDGDSGYLTKRFRVGKKMKAWRMAVTNIKPNQPLYVLKLSMEGRRLSRRY